MLPFAVFALVLGGIVLGALYAFARPAIVHAIVDWGAENPTALKLPLVADLVRGELGASLTEPVDATDFREIILQIAYGDTTADIGDALVQTGVIADARAFVFESNRSLMATTAMSLGYFCRIERKERRPILPNPLIPTFTAILLPPIHKIINNSFVNIAIQS